MTSVTVTALDARVELDLPDPVGAAVAEALADISDGPDAAAGRDATDGPDAAGIPDARGHEPARIAWIVSPDGTWKVVRAARERAVLDPAEALAVSLIDVNRIAVESVAPADTVLHAGAFEVAGGAVAVVGASGAGKSTLVAAAVLAGHGYLADEVCAFDPEDRRVRPYHRPVGLRPAGAAAIGVAIPEHPLGLYGEVFPWRAGAHGRLAAATPLTTLAFVHRRPGPVEVVPVRPAEALVRLTTLGLDVAGVERVMFRRLDRLVREVDAVTVGFEDSLAAVEALAGLCGEGSAR